MLEQAKNTGFRSVILTAVAMAIAILMPALATGNASAASSYCYGGGGICPVFNGSNSGLYYADIPNYAATSMICWEDSQWYSVNYSSNRWFKVTTPYTSTTWMHSSEVYNQTTVPHC
jgi:hypothetical protein